MEKENKLLKVVLKQKMKHIVLDKKHTTNNIMNKYGKLVEYEVIGSNSRYNRVEMIFTRKDGIYFGTDIVRYPFRIIYHELGVNCRFYNLRGNFAIKTLRNGIEIKDISKVLGHSKIETLENYYIVCGDPSLIEVSETI